MSERAWFSGRVARRGSGRAAVEVLARSGEDGWKAVAAPRKLFPRAGQVELQGAPAMEACAGEWLAFQVADDGRPGGRQARITAHRFLPRYADLRGLGTAEAGRFLFTRQGWDGSAEPGHWAVRFSDDRLLSLQLERARDGRLRCPERSVGRVACLAFEDDRVSPEPVDATGTPLYDARDDAPLALHDWSPGADYVAHVVRALAGADDPRLPELIAWLDLHREAETGRVSAIGTEHELAFEALRSGELARRLSADREVMAAYLDAARSDPAVAVALERALTDQAERTRTEARANAERALAAEFERLGAEQAARVAAREEDLLQEARGRVAERERKLAAEAEAHVEERAAAARDEAAWRLAEANSGAEAAAAGRAAMEAERASVAERVGELREEVRLLEAAAEGATERVATVEREAAEAARRGITAQRPPARVQRPEQDEVATVNRVELGRRIAACALLTPAGKALMSDFAAFTLAGEVPILEGAGAEDFALVAETLLAAGRLVPFDADETVLAPDDVWSRPGTGLASQVSQAAALAAEGATHLVMLRNVNRTAARTWHRSLVDLARAGMTPRPLLLFAIAGSEPDEADGDGSPPASDGACRLRVSDAIAAGAALLAPRLLGAAAGKGACCLDPGARPTDLSGATAALVAIAGEGVELGLATAARIARAAAEAAALAPDDQGATARAADRFRRSIGLRKAVEG